MKAILLSLLIAIGSYATYLRHQSSNAIEVAGEKSETLAVEVDSLRAALAAASQPAGPNVVEIEARREARLEELMNIYDNNLADLTAQKAMLSESRSSANSIYRNLTANRPIFSEQGFRFNRDGSTSTVGVRTSDANRAATLEKYNTGVQQVSNQVAAIEGEMVSLDGRFATLEHG